MFTPSLTLKSDQIAHFVIAIRHVDRRILVPHFAILDVQLRRIGMQNVQAVTFQIVLRQRRLLVDAAAGIFRFHKANMLPRAADRFQVLQHFLDKQLAQVGASLQLQLRIELLR